MTSFVSVGNKADVSSNDLLEWWEDDDETEMVILYLESFGNPRAFSRIARRLARRKPILALKGGSTRAGSRAAGSHTAALAGSDVAVDALFRQAGVIRAHTLDELIDVATLLSAQPVPRGPRVALITNAGGLGILAADACEAAGLELPQPGEATRAALAEVMPQEGSDANPVDLLGGANAESFEQALPPVLADPAFEPRSCSSSPPSGRTSTRSALRSAGPQRRRTASPSSAFSSARRARRRACAASPTFPRLRIPRRRRVRSGGRPSAASGSGSRPAWCRSSSATATRLRPSCARRSRPADGWLDAEQTRRLLEAYGLPVVPERVAATKAAAVEAARELGFPVVLKTAAPGAHKTEQGGIALDLVDEAAVLEAAEKIGPPFLVQPFVRGGAELLAGAVQDPVFGPLVAFGPGGVLAELIGEAQFRLAPLTDRDAGELVRSGKAGRLVAGFRGTPARRRARSRRPPPAPLEARRGAARGRGARPESRCWRYPTAASPSTPGCASRTPATLIARRAGSATRSSRLREGAITTEGPHVRALRVSVGD